MAIFSRIIQWISSLKVAIFLFLLIALASAIGTTIPQGQSFKNYLDTYTTHPWLGLLNGEQIIFLQLDHVYTSSWFLALLAWLGIALLLCSWRRQWPILKAALIWVDYKEPRQLSKLAIAQTIAIEEAPNQLEQLAFHLKNQGWAIKQYPNRIAARQGVIGRTGPPLVHIGLVLLMIGSVWGAINGERIEQFLTPGKSFDLINKNEQIELKLTLKDFQIDRDPSGRAEQFHSKIELLIPNQEENITIKEASVNHPIRFKGLTIYQADWALEAITLQIGKNPPLQLPLRRFPELGEQIWGLVLPTTPEGGSPILLSLSSEQGPIRVFDENGDLLGILRPGITTTTIKGIPLTVVNILQSSGLLLKHDPGVPIVYLAFAITLIGACLSIISTKQLWAVIDPNQSAIHFGGLSNRNVAGLANEFPKLINSIQ